MAFEKLSRFFGMTEDDEDEDYETENQQDEQSTITSGAADQATNNVGNVVPMNNSNRSLARKIVISEPRIYADAKEIATNLLNNQATIVNFSQMDDQQSRRVIDFLTGTVFAIKGEIQRVGDKIFLCTPAKFEIEGSISDVLQSDKDFN
ncbi:cell division protein SepF [Lapidilactobacillus mulanensis]|uniref:Cell division protein SepF n=1 Tax=Lapidilactobacillus mulanensis TaxID=2485999 RepID=A0ABW4DN25_9LACO|nr:cell division protein SepF [Lapidilactobacillus mulanensis]